SKYGEQKQAKDYLKNILQVLSPSTQGIKLLTKHLRSWTEAWIRPGSNRKSFVLCLAEQWA
ncbi:hypothetical protein, partial [Cronobacter sakazakii]|uniref:hypothetical protein n=1 Tax=Cronobacter sakazakii TaxID=28141 RepID=UPI003A873C4A